MPPKVGRSRRTSKKAADETPSSGFGSSLASTLRKKLGDDVIVDPDDERLFSQPKEYISTQCYGLDWAMHLPGLPVGRINAIRGDFMSAKSTIAQHVMAETQARGGFCVYIDTEYAFDESRAKRIGLLTDEEHLLMPQVDTMEQAIAVIDKTVDAALADHEDGNDRLVTIVWDSVGATPPAIELTNEFDQAVPARMALIMSRALRRITGKIAKARILLLLVNQERSRLDFMAQGKDLKSMAAEKPIMFHSTVVLKPQLKKKLTNSKKEPTGIRVKCTVTKNKLAAPFSIAEFVCGFKNGINNVSSKLEVAQQQKIVRRQGSWYVYEGDKFQERGFAAILDANPQIMEELERIKAALKEDAESTVPKDEDIGGEDDEEDEDDDD